eukprot:TRINITY_DN576_c0_g1_i11.p2 TRINITY_DN576_c0_g1~~TRINITY_DN576_c0_g1_i11.p2  ORF type:complete len:281 (+),score=24.78 TRINITY_DN576_c0_g1_i11:248-1090(+)
MTSLADKFQDLMQTNSQESKTKSDAVDIKQTKSFLERKLSVEVQSPRTPKDLTFKDLVKTFDFQETHRAKLLSTPRSYQYNKGTDLNFKALEEQPSSPSYSHLLAHEVKIVRQGKSLPVQKESGIRGVLKQWMQRYKSHTDDRQREKQRYGRKMPLPRQVVHVPVEEPETVDVRRCLSISEGQKFWDTLVTQCRSESVTLPRSKTQDGPILRSLSKSTDMKGGRVDIPLNIGGDTTPSSQTLSISTLDKIDETGMDTMSVNSVSCGFTYSEDSYMSSKLE